MTPEEFVYRRHPATDKQDAQHSSAATPTPPLRRAARTRVQIPALDQAFAELASGSATPSGDPSQPRRGRIDEGIQPHSAMPTTGADAPHDIGHDATPHRTWPPSHLPLDEWDESERAAARR